MLMLQDVHILIQTTFNFSHNQSRSNVFGALVNIEYGASLFIFLI